MTQVMNNLQPKTSRTQFPAIRRSAVKTIQANITLKCNQTCQHCHVNASPRRSEMMKDEVIDKIIECLEQDEIEILDITGGAPEMHPRFRELVIAARARNIQVIDRCNLTIGFESGQEDVFEFLAEHGVQVVASMPCYLEENVDTQRGKGVFQKSIQALQALNALGYAKPESHLQLNLVYNPQGASLPPPQEQLQAAYKKYLFEEYGIAFNDLFVICNMPIQRFAGFLQAKHQHNDYMRLLKTAYRKENLNSVMCKTMLSIDWQGYVYDCDFNQMLGLKRTTGKNAVHINDYDFSNNNDDDIIVDDHCYACTAGQGSSCGGALQ